MKHSRKILIYLVTLLTSYLLVQTDLLSQDDSLTKTNATICDSNEVNKAIEARIFMVQKYTSECDSNTISKQKFKNINGKKVKNKTTGDSYWWFRFSLGYSKGTSKYMNRDFGSFKISVGYWSKSILFPLSLSTTYSEETEETSGKPAIYQADVGLSAFIPWGEHYPFLVFELGGGVAFGNVRIINESIINQKIEKIESTENFTSPYFSASVELLFAGIGDDFSLGIMAGYSWNTKRTMTSFMLVVHYVRPF